MSGVYAGQGESGSYDHIPGRKTFTERLRSRCAEAVGRLSINPDEVIDTGLAEELQLLARQLPPSHQAVFYLQSLGLNSQPPLFEFVGNSMTIPWSHDQLNAD